MYPGVLLGVVKRIVLMGSATRCDMTTGLRTPRHVIPDTSTLYVRGT